MTTRPKFRITLQDKIDAIYNEYGEEEQLRLFKTELDKAIQQLREEIEHTGTLNAKWIPKDKVLSLIGEKK